MMKHKGLHSHRLKNEPLELKFAKKWDEEQKSTWGRYDGKGILDYLLAEKIGHPNCEVTERDIKVAATVIQWLGSVVGQSFLREVGFSRIEKSKEEK